VTLEITPHGRLEEEVTRSEVWWVSGVFLNRDGVFLQKLIDGQRSV
jgi:hypothetical protein